MSNLSEMAAIAESLVEIKALGSLIQTSIAGIEAKLQKPFPSPNSSFTRESEGPRLKPEVQKDIKTLVAAAYQLISITRSPQITMTTMMTSYALSASLGVAARAHVAEICREGGAQGTHVKDIAAVTGTSPTKLARVLRVLTTNHIFVELSPDMFANNRISSLMDTGKAFTASVPNPTINPIGVAVTSGVGHCTDECLKAASYMADAMFDPLYAQSGEPTKTALNLAFKTDLPVFDWFDTPGNEDRLSRFGITMDAARRVSAPEAVLHGFGWDELPDGALVVDVGGGLGSQSMILAKTHQSLRFVVQDRVKVIKEAESFWKSQTENDEDTKAYNTGRVALQAHDFFKEQPVRDADVFFLRWIMHDWSDEYCLTILRHLRAAAKRTTQLLIVDNLISYTCNEEDASGIDGVAQRDEASKPLLPNYGHANSLAYFTDIQVMNTLSGQERTITQFKALLAEAGWKLIRVAHNQVPSSSKVIAVPI